MSKEKSGIDVLKFIGSIMIFSMHMFAFQDLGKFQFIWEVMSRWAVPVFFITSAYFLFSANSGSIGYANIKKYTKRIGMLYSVWFIYNIPNILWVRVLSRHSYTLYDWFMILKNAFLSSTFTGSWYLLSSIFCAWLIFFFLKRKMSINHICIIAFLFQIICVFTSVYRGTLPNYIMNIFLGGGFPLNIVGGIFYFALGLFLANNQNMIYKEKKQKYVVIMVVSFFTYISEIEIAKYFGVYGTSDQAFSLIPLSASIFILGMQSSIKIANTKILRNMSTIIYCAQGNVLLIKVLISKAFGINSSLFLFLICSLIMSCIIIGVFFLQKRKIWWAKYLT